MKKILFLLVLIFLFGSTYSQQWERISPKPIETSLFDITQVPGTNRIIAVGSGSSLLYSDNNGESWKTCFRPANTWFGVKYNSIHMLDNNLGYIAGTNSVILKTSDGGNTWEKISFIGSMELLEVYFINENCGLIGTSNLLYRTSDGGLNWDTVCSGATPNSLHFVNDSVGYFSSYSKNAYYKSIDKGLSWQLVGNLTEIEDLYVLAVNFNDELKGVLSGIVESSSDTEYYMFNTNDGGINWNQTYVNYTNKITKITRLNQDTIAGVGVRIMYDNMIIFSYDGGNTWVESEMPTNWWDLNNIGFSANGTCFSVGTLGQILKSVDNCQTFQLITSQVGNISSINSSAKINDTTILAGCTFFGGGMPQGGIYITYNKGISWTRLFSSYPIADVYSKNNSCATVSNYVGEIYYSHNSGENWHYSEVNYFGFEPRCICIANDSLMFVGGYAGKPIIYKSSDGGINWNNVNLPNNLDWDLWDIDFMNDSTGMALSYVAEGTGIVKTIDYGDNWYIDTIINADLQRINFTYDSIGFLTGSYTILKSSDYGNNWRQVADGYSFADLDFPNKLNGYVLIYNNEVCAMKSTDGGESWYEIDYPTTSSPQTVTFFNENEGLFMGNYGTIFKTYTGGVVDIPELPKFEVKNQDELYCYPIPAKDILKIRFQNTNNFSIAKYKIYNISGTEVCNGSINNTNNEGSIDVSQIKNGIYLLRVITNTNKIYICKFIVII